MEEIANIVYEVKEKLTDNEYKTIMDKLGECRTKIKDMYKIWFIKTSLIDGDNCDCKISMDKASTYVKLSIQEYNNILNCINDTGSYSLCGHKLDEWTGNCFNGYEHIPILFSLEKQDFNLNYIVCEINITKIEKVA